MTNYMAIDQYGETYHNLGKYPRTELLNRLGRKHADKMYCDKTDGGYRHVGYIIGGLWLNLFVVTPFEK